MGSAGGGTEMEPIELVLAFALGIAVGYVIRASISAVRQQKAYHYRRERARAAAESAERLRAAEAARPLTTPKVVEPPASWLNDGRPVPDQFPISALAPAPLGPFAP